MPVVVLRCPRRVFEELSARGWHGGYSRDASTGIDAGLIELFGRDDHERPGPPDPAQVAGLSYWVSTVREEAAALGGGALCTLWHPAIDADLVRRVAPGRVIEIDATTAEEAVAQLPDDLPEPRLVPMPVVLLRSSRETMEALAAHGWHSGFWKDETNGYDMGVESIMRSRQEAATRRDALLQVVRLLHRQLPPGGIVTLWHPELTADLLHAPDVDVLEITAEDPEQALATLAGIHGG